MDQEQDVTSRLGQLDDRRAALQSKKTEIHGLEHDKIPSLQSARDDLARQWRKTVTEIRETRKDLAQAKHFIAEESASITREHNDILVMSQQESASDKKGSGVDHTGILAPSKSKSNVLHNAPTDLPHKPADIEHAHSSATSVNPSRAASSLASNKPAAIQHAHSSTTPVNPSRATASSSSPAGWSVLENEACHLEMAEVVKNPKFKGKNARWNEVSRRLAKNHNIRRSGNAVQNQWNRRLRGLAKGTIEDRSDRRGESLITSSQV